MFIESYRINLSKHNLNILKKIQLKYISIVKFYIFGSRLKTSYISRSDLDIMLIWKDKKYKKLYYKLLEEIEESNITIICDLVNYDEVCSAFLQEIQRNMIFIMYV